MGQCLALLDELKKKLVGLTKVGVILLLSIRHQLS